jgi:UDP-2-acetamido-3-amino-2,3-dideoxy-glucuronate N-acetyltransferase
MGDKNIKRDLALIGAGYWGKNLARNFNQLGALHTICDQSEALLENFKTEDYSNVSITTSLEIVLKDPNIKRVAIAVPAALHYEVAIQALKAGKDVYVEKPLCLHVKHGENLVKEAEKEKRILMVGHLLQYHPCIIKLQDLVKNGKLGKLYYLSSNRLNLGKIRREENALWSFAPHDISVILSLVGYIEPKEIRCIGEAYINQKVVDTTLTTMLFDSNIRAHIHVSWLNPFKEQKLTVVGSQGMAVFDDSKPWAEKLILHKDYLSWNEGQIPTLVKKPGEFVSVGEEEPLKKECEHFLESCIKRVNPKTDGKEGLISLKVLNAAQESLEKGGALTYIRNSSNSDKEGNHYSAHQTAVIDAGAQIGDQTHIWHFSHIFSGAKIGKKCNIGQNVVVCDNVELGDNTKIQNNVSIFSGVKCEEDVFLGPSCVFTNISNPRSQVNRKNLYQQTHIKKGATVGANATIVCGTTIGKYAFIGAGAVVTKDVDDYALVVGNPARKIGWMSRHGHKLSPNGREIIRCPESQLKYQLNDQGKLKCVDLNENEHLPDELAHGQKSYEAYKH